MILIFRMEQIYFDVGNMFETGRYRWMQHNNRETREIERKKLASISTGFAV